MNIEYYTKNVYGNEHYYAADEKQAADIRLITKQRTLQPNVMEGLTRLGFTFKEILNPKTK